MTPLPVEWNVVYRGIMNKGVNPLGFLETAIRPEVTLHEAAEHRVTRWQAAVEVFFVFVVFYVYAGWPTPDVNESQYLCKAKQFWNPDWLPGDFFLNTADAHLVFCWTFGWLTKYLSLPAFAWCGRVIVWAAMAWAWRRLSFALIAQRWYAVLTAVIFAWGTMSLHMAGEWVLGGLEAKGPAYVLILLGIERLLRNRWNTALLLFGAASAFHVLVGGWTVVAVGICWLWPERLQPRLRTILPGLAGGFLLALPGIVPALALSWNAPDRVFHEANFAYVSWRLRHHLLPDAISTSAILVHVLYFFICLGALWALPLDHRFRRLGGVMFGAGLIAAGGFALYFCLQPCPPLLYAVMRFYWFRLSDVLVPLGFSFVLAALSIICWNLWSSIGFMFKVCFGLFFVFSSLLFTRDLVEVAYERFGAPPRADDSQRSMHLDWVDVCQVAKERTPRDARFLTPRSAQTFHWYAERAEVANLKDIPQDAASIVEWHRRMKDMHKVRQRGVTTLAAQGVAEVTRLAKKYDADFVVTRSAPLLALTRLYVNRTYAIYDLRQTKTPQR